MFIYVFIHIFIHLLIYWFFYLLGCWNMFVVNLPLKSTLGNHLLPGENGSCSRGLVISFPKSRFQTWSTQCSDITHFPCHLFFFEVYHSFLSRLLKRMTSHPKMWHKDCQTLALNDAKTEAKNLSVWELLVEADGNSYLHVAWWLDPKCSLLFCELNPRHVPPLW